MITKFLILCLLTINSLAQFTPTNGPTGGSFSLLHFNDNILYALTNRGNLFKNEVNQWSRISSNLYSNKLFFFNEKLFSISNSGLVFSEDFGITWSDDILSGYTETAAILNSQLYVVVNDTIYNSADGTNWTQTFDSLKIKSFAFGETFYERLINIKDIYIQDSLVVLACNSELFINEQGIFYSTDFGQSWNRTNGLDQFIFPIELVRHEDKLYLASSEGVFVTANLGNNWQSFNSGFSDSSQNRVNSLEVIENKLYALKNNPADIFVFENGNWNQITDLGDVYKIINMNENILFTTFSGSIKLLNLSSKEITDYDYNLNASNSSVFAVNDDVALAHTISNEAKITNNGGVTWQNTGITLKHITKTNDTIFYNDGNSIYSTVDLFQNNLDISSNIPAALKENISVLVSTSNDLFVGFNKTRRRDHLSPVWEAGGFYKSTNKGENWFSASSGLPSEGNIKTPVYSLIANGELLVAKTFSGTYRSTNGGENWSLFESGLDNYESIFLGIAFEDKIVVSTYYSIYYMSAESSSWTKLTEGLPDANNIFSYKFTVLNNKLFLYDSEEKQFYNLEKNKWVQFGAKQNEYFEPITFSTADNFIYASVVDGGIWKGTLDIASNLSDKVIPAAFELNQNYPNPFNPSTSIEYTVPSSEYVTLKVYDILGNEAAELVNELKSVGKYEVKFNASNLASGVYFYRLQTSSGVILTKKLMLLK